MKREMIKRTAIISAFLALFILIIYSVFGAHVVLFSSGSTSSSVNQSTSVIYNFSVNNTGNQSSLNITMVNVTLPSSFTFVGDTNGTSASGNFSNETSTLTWANDGLVMNNTIRHFWFNASASDAGNYNITIRTINSTSYVETNLTVQVNDTTSPVAEFGTNPSSNYYDRDGNVTFDFRCTDNVNVSNIQVWANWSNGTSNIWHMNYSNSSYSSGAWINLSVNVSEGKDYRWMVYCNDTRGYTNNTTNRTFSVDTHAPEVTFVFPKNDAEYTLNSNGERKVDFKYQVWDNFGTKNCSLYVDDVRVENETPTYNGTTNNTISYTFDNDDTYAWIIGCYDNAGWADNYSERDIVINPYSSASSGGGDEDTEDDTIVNQTVGEVTSTKTISNLLKYAKVTFTVNGTAHTITVLNISSYSAFLKLASLPVIFSAEIGVPKIFDLNENGQDDFSVNLTRVTSGSVYMVLELIPETALDTNLSGNNTVTTDVKSSEPLFTISPESWKWIALALAVIAVAFAVATGIAVQRKKKGSWWKRGR
jgi:hypothetical protein